MSGSDDVEARLRGLGRAEAGTTVGSGMPGLIASLAGAAAGEGLLDVAYVEHDSPLGALLLAASAEGLVLVGLPGAGQDRMLDLLADRISPRVMRAPTGVLDHARGQLDDYFAGARREFDVPLDWRLTRGFRRQVLDQTALIPYGRTASYAELADRAGRPRAVRAAGSACATNPLPLVVPCHRVVRSDGSLGNYGGGAPAKAFLLEMEGAL